VDERWTFTSDEVIRGMIEEAFASRGLAPPREKVSASSMLLRSRLVATGRYLTVLPDSVLRSNAKSWGVKILPVDFATRPMAVTIVTLKNRTLSPVAQIFIEHVRAVARAHGSK
jgi:DNA-binding transcriptional LysR family regulator